MSLQTGQVIEGKYRITRLLGEGGMGAVYEGENIRIRRKVAIKVLHAAFTENQEVVQRFEREAQAAGRIGNDHILEVLDLGQLEGGDLYLVMEFLDGEALSDRARKSGRMAPEAVTPLMLQVLEGLSAAHSAGIIHRDLKPDNLFILREKAGKKDFVKIIDFGISKFQPLSGDGMKMTKTGAMMGTPYYMSPEQATGGGETDLRSDIYALGVILFECVAGTVPFDAPTFNQLLFKIALTPTPSLAEVAPGTDPAFCSIVAKAMAREPSARFGSCEEFATALEEWLKDRKGVSVPPPVSEESLRADVVHRASQVALPAAVAAPPSGAGSKTAGSWSTTQDDAPKSRAPSMGVRAAIGAVAVGVLGIGVYVALGAGDEKTADAAAQPPAVATAQSQAADSVREAEERAKKAEEEAKKVLEDATRAREEAKKAEEAVRKAAEEAKKAADTEAKAAAETPKAVAATAPARPAARPAAAKPAAKLTPKPTAGGDDDFGY